MFPDSGNSGDLGDGRAGCTAANSSTQQPDRGVLEIAVNEDTACYYVPGNGELVKSIELSGEMEVELFLIR